MIDVSFDINGRKVSPRNMGNALESVAAFVWNGWQASRGISGRLGLEYAQKPKIKVKGRKLDSLSFEVSGCCDQLIETVKKKLK